MSNDLVVGAVIALMVIASVSYLVYQRRKGVSSCGCKGCSRCKGSGSNVTIDEADGETQIAPEEDVVNSNAVERTIRFSDNKTLVMRTSSYANFALDIIPQGSLNITGILGRYRDTWQLTVRTLNDIEINK